MFYLFQSVVSNYAFLVLFKHIYLFQQLKHNLKGHKLGIYMCGHARRQDSRTRTRQSLVLDHESCPQDGISLSHTRNYK